MSIIHTYDAPCRGLVPDRPDFCSDIRRWLTPCEVMVDLIGGEILSGIRGSPEVKWWPRQLYRSEIEPAATDIVIPPVKIHGLAGEQLPPDLQKFASLSVSFVVRNEDAVTSKFGGVSAHHDV